MWQTYTHQKKYYIPFSLLNLLVFDQTPKNIASIRNSQSAIRFFCGFS